MSPSRIRPRLIGVWSLLAVLVASIVAIELSDRVQSQGEDNAALATRDPRLLVPVTLEQVAAVEVAHSGTVHRFERDATGLWFYHGAHAGSDATHAHQPDPVMAGRIDTALQGFDRTRIERTLSTEQGVQQYGLAAPKMSILVYRAKQLEPLLQVAVGDLAPDKLSRYVMVVGKPSVITVANYQIDNLLGLIKAAVESSQARAAPKPS